MNIITFPKEERKNFKFISRDTNIKNDEDNNYDAYPSIILIDERYNIPVVYTGYERYIQPLSASYANKGGTLSKKSFFICHFLNFILYETIINSINECTLNDIRQYMIYSKKKDNGEFYAKETWERRIDAVLAFLRSYYVNFCNYYQFGYSGNELQTHTIVNDDNMRKRVILVKNIELNVKSPTSNHKKNRVLMHGYLELLLFEAKKYDPMIALAIALQAYSGIREGEVVNLSCGGITEKRGAFSSLASIELDLNQKAKFWEEYNRKTPPGEFKKKQTRTQKVYDSFIKEVHQMYEAHIDMLQAKGLSTKADSPLFVNKHGKPMTVETYKKRVKDLFYNYFLPKLKASCYQSSTWAENAAHIEVYEKEYPGAHMFRHWFTMYLLTKAGLDVAEVQKWRNDHSPESMSSYIHENEDLIKAYRESAYSFQRDIIERIGKINGSAKE